MGPKEGLGSGFTPGHEIVGDVVQIGEGEPRFKVGDRVGGGWHGYHCGHCKSCRKGDFVTCENQGINGVTSHGGYVSIFFGFASL